MTAAELGRSGSLVRWPLRLYLLHPLAEVVNLGEVKNLSFLVLGKVPVAEKLEAFGRRHWQLDLLVKLLLLLLLIRSLTVFSLEVLA